MRLTSLLYLAAAIIPFTPAAAAPAQAHYVDLRRIAPVHGDAGAAGEKAMLCVSCHGENGVSIAPIFPNLAGQSAEYLYWELVEYRRANGPQSAMTPLVATLTEADLRDLAAYFARVAGNASTSAATTGPSTPPEATEAPDAGKLARGEHLYRQGDAARGAPPCQGCHGSEATGNPLTQEPHTAGVAYYRTYPALRGQKAAYLVSRLGQYRGGQLVDSSNDFIMQGVAARLDDDSIDAIATWLSSLPPR